jgi:hypothetical protein
VRWSGGTTILGVGTSADDDHPLVLERPDLFTDEAPGADLRGPGRAASAAEAPVERATRAPGEVRPAVKKAAPAKKDTGGADNG